MIRMTMLPCCSFLIDSHQWGGLSIFFLDRLEIQSTVVSQLPVGNNAKRLTHLEIDSHTSKSTHHCDLGLYQIECQRISQLLFPTNIRVCPSIGEIIVGGKFGWTIKKRVWLQRGSSFPPFVLFLSLLHCVLSVRWNQVLRNSSFFVATALAIDLRSPPRHRYLF